jgi:hypothetical protein
MFRDIVPKGTSFDSFTQETVNIIFSHVNGVKRKIFYGRSPYEMFSFTYGSEVTAILGVTEIPADEVVQSPILLKRLLKPHNADNSRPGQNLQPAGKG